MNNPQTLELEIKELQLKKDVLFEEVKLRREINELNKDIDNLGGNPVVNFQNNIIYVGLVTWGAISFVFGNLFTALDSVLIRFEEIEQEEYSRSKKR